MAEAKKAVEDDATNAMGSAVTHHHAMGNRAMPCATKLHGMP